MLENYNEVLTATNIESYSNFRMFKFSAYGFNEEPLGFYYDGKEYYLVAGYSTDDLKEDYESFFH